MQPRIFSKLTKFWGMQKRLSEQFVKSRDAVYSEVIGWISRNCKKTFRRKNKKSSSTIFKSKFAWFRSK